MSHHYGDNAGSSELRKLLGLPGDDEQESLAAAKQSLAEKFEDVKREMYEKQFRDIERGGTGRYPHGQLTPGDEGEIRFTIDASPSHGVVIVDFGKPLRSVCFTHDEAMALAESLQKAARELAENKVHPGG